MSIFPRRAEGAIFLYDRRSRSRVVCREGLMPKEVLSQVCTQHEPPIAPVARTFFALCDIKTGMCLSPYQKLNAADARKQYQLRVFVNTGQNGYHFQKMSKAAYKYYHDQLREDFVRSHLSPPVTVNTAVWMAAIDMAKDATEKNKKFEEITGDLLHYMPEVLREKYRTDTGMQYQLRNTFDKFLGIKGSVSIDHFRGKYIEVYEKDEMCGTHIFKLKQPGTLARREQVSLLFVSSRRGIYKMRKNLSETSQEGVCTIEQVQQVVINLTALTATLTKKTEKDGIRDVLFNFRERAELVAFGVVVDTYYRLQIDGNKMVLEGDLRPPEGCIRVGLHDDLKANICHAFISPEAVQEVLHKFNLEDGYFMVRESRTEQNAFTLSLCHREKIMNFRIVRQSDGMLAFNYNESEGINQEMFPTLHALIQGHQHKKNGLPTYLKTNCSPEITGPIPLVTVPPQTTEEGSPSLDNPIIKDLAAVGVRVILYEELEFKEELGSGNFSNVYKALWKRKEGEEEEEEEKEQTVAVKVPTMKSTNVSAVVNDLKREIETMSHLDHQHVIKLLGITSTNHFLTFIGQIPMVIMEFIKSGSLSGYLERLRHEYHRAAHQGNDLIQQKMPTLLLFCAQISEGMRYLEEQKVVHRDLATRNVLVVSEQCVKISDFGLARQRLEEKEYYKCNEPRDLPIFWYAPESLQELKFTHKSDVWSYGVVMWEVFSLGDTPTRHFQHFIRGAKTTGEMFERLVHQYQRGTQLPKPPHCKDVYHTVMKQCWLLNEARRPSFTDLVLKFKLQS